MAANLIVATIEVDGTTFDSPDVARHWLEGMLIGKTRLPVAVTSRYLVNPEIDSCEKLRQSFKFFMDIHEDQDATAQEVNAAWANAKRDFGFE